ncbi:hypothetical protein BCR44DRAFT_1443014 [Catenaria anguillulae PL171]|uniref:Uncharacterized protein n=1 Tax=Catenaria anguillulae PL171 TaxID=765915 RepID=A0A1Y2H952_9FUNG|nr:hypothetical protein BCR44DRAFT_1443014 [Catenaria anguillulae PL171]
MRAPYVRFRNMLPADIAKTLPTSLDRRQQPSKSPGAGDLVDQSQVIDRSTLTATPSSSAASPAASESHDVVMDDITSSNPWASSTDTSTLDTLEPAPSKTTFTSKPKRPISRADSDDDDDSHQVASHVPVSVVALDGLPSFFDPQPVKAKTSAKARKSDSDELDDMFATIDANATTGRKLVKNKVKAAAIPEPVGKVNKNKVKKAARSTSKSAAKGKDEIDDLFGSLF